MGTSLVGGPVVKNPPWNAEDTGSVAGQGTKIPHAVEQLSWHAITTEPTLQNWVCGPQWKIPHEAVKIPCAATKNWHSQIKNKLPALFVKNIDD